MGMLQVKNLSDELHVALAARAAEQGVTMSEYVTRLLRLDLSRPSLDAWIAARRAESVAPRPIDVVHALDEVRVEYAPTSTGTGDTAAAPGARR